MRHFWWIRYKKKPRKNLGEGGSGKKRPFLLTENQITFSLKQNLNIFSIKKVSTCHGISSTTSPQTCTVLICSWTWKRL